ncbi:MAG: glycosyltransferase [Candidatus Eisenbacteria bacterium]|uniref:Glycosyltransferase n=1 Tax=Eiseniibacteriota bacterium TaxID=2212470 RepID=A0A849SM88_UNCEI|nr:glycosyltransferase [Candidatus Eisenbacteria bacterium]
MCELSVLVPVRDARAWLPASLRSLWRQSFRDFEVVAVDDGSRDGSAEWLDREAGRETRLRVIHTPARGLPTALATAFAAARADVIARHDADDVSHRERFTLQRAAFRADPALDVLGTRLRLFPDSQVGAGMRRWRSWHDALLTHEAMEREALIDSPLAHGTLMARRAALERAGGWIERGWAEDVDLWLRLFRDGARFAKLPRVLYGWRRHAASATHRDPRYRPAAYRALRLAALRSGFLAHRRDVMLVAVGATLEHWRRSLEEDGCRVSTRSFGRPSAAALATLSPPLVLAFGARPARERWRAALVKHGWNELSQFIFTG